MREVELPAGNVGRYYPNDGWTEHLTMGEGGPIHATYLRTPAGDYTEQEVTQTTKTVILSGIPETVQLGKMLCRLRDERSNREEAIRYGMAVRLQDRCAEVHLRGLLRSLARAEH